MDCPPHFRTTLNPKFQSHSMRPRNMDCQPHFRTTLITPLVQNKISIINKYLMASERSERDTLSRSSLENAIRIYVYVIARVGVKFGINFTSARLSGNKIARGEAECYLPLNLTRVKFVPEISRLTVLLKINTKASLLFIYNVLVLSSLARQ